MTNGSDFRIYTQDLRAWREFDPESRKPGPEFKSFPTRWAAVAYRATLPKDDKFIVTMTAAPPPRAKRTVDPQTVSVDFLGGRMHRSGHKLTD